MRAGVKVLWLCTALALSAGCNVYRYKENQYRQKLKRVGVSEYSVVLDAGTVRYWSGGTGPTVLLIHGFGGHALWQWHAQVGPLLDRGMHIVAPDLAWFGETTPAHAVYSVESQVELFIQLMDRLEVPRYSVVGISYGGFIAAGMAAIQPDRIEQLVLVDSPGPVYGRSDYEQMLERLGTDSAAGLLIPRDGPGIRTLLDATFHKPPRIPGFALDDLYESGFSDRTEEKRLMLASVESSYRDGRRVFPSQQTLIVWGEHDKLFPIDLAHRLAEALGPDTQVAILPDAGHASNLEQPDAFNDVLLHFLAPGPADDHD